MSEGAFIEMASEIEAAKEHSAADSLIEQVAVRSESRDPIVANAD